MWHYLVVGLVPLALLTQHVSRMQARYPAVDTCAGPLLNDGRPYQAQMMGMGGNDQIISFEPRDRLDGGTDNDLLRGGGGDDDLIGGPGADQFIYDEWETSTGRDRIEDFQLGEDMLAFADELRITRIRHAAGSSMLSLSNGGCVILVGVARLPADQSEYVTREIPDSMRGYAGGRPQPLNQPTRPVEQPNATPVPPRESSIQRQDPEGADNEQRDALPTPR